MLKQLLIATASLTAVAGSASAGAVTLNFDTLTTGATVDSYYAGGMDSLGEIGPDYGVTFTPGDWIVAAGPGATSQPNFAFSSSGTGIIDFANGTTSITFTYGAFTDAHFQVYSGLDGTGTMLADDFLPAVNPFAFSFAALPFSGTAKSIVLGADMNTFGLDDLTVDGTGTVTPPPAPVPEPASWAMMLAGLGLVGFAMRRGAQLRGRAHA